MGKGLNACLGLLACAGAAAVRSRSAGPRSQHPVASRLRLFPAACRLRWRRPPGGIRKRSPASAPRLPACRSPVVPHGWALFTLS